MCIATGSQTDSGAGFLFTAKTISALSAYSAVKKGMDIRELTEEMHRFVAAKGWYEPDSPRPQTPRNLAASLAIEAAEVLEHYQWDGSADPASLADELADVALYLLQLASLTGIDLEQAILNKLRVNYNREWPSQKEEPE
jgi:NTP pyrophosphatase (non-canonical NTP hydrolase)